MEEKIIMSVPRINVMPWEFGLVRTTRLWTVSLGKMKKYFPKSRWSQISDDEVLLIDKPEYVDFRNFFTGRIVRRRLMTAIATKDDKFFHALTLYLM